MKQPKRTRPGETISEFLENEPKRETEASKALAAHRLQVRIQDLERAKATLLKELADRDEQLAIYRDLASAKPPKSVAARKGRGRDKRLVACPVMLCSDWHIEEHVDPVTVNGLNEYTLDIADRCIDRLAEAFEWLVRDQRFDMRQALIWLGGDLFSGYIHEELMEHNFLSPVQACLWLLERIEKLLRRILAQTDFELIHVNCNDGNHGRLTHKIRVSTRTANSLEYMLYKNLAARFRDEPRIQFNIAEGEYLYHEVFDQTLCFFHGDSVRYQGGVGGLLIPMKRGLNEHRKVRKVDVYNFGHFHQYLSLQDMTGNGSMIGLNPYSLRLKCAPEPRQQAFYLIDSVRGKCQATPIWL